MNAMYSVENEYETTVEPRRSHTVSTEHLATESQAVGLWERAESLVWRFVVVLTIVFAVVALILSGRSHQNASNYLQKQSAKYGHVKLSSIPRSCQGYSGKSGVYIIQPDPYTNPFETYCDMSTNGGGWTLVGAVHENNIAGKCSAGDLWSSDQGYVYSRNIYNGTNNWGNENVFGNVRNLFTSDLKNSAYSDVQARDVLIWHVPNNASLETMADQAFLKYYTTDSVLNRYGGTLQSLYSNHTPIRPAGSYRFYKLVASKVTYAVGNNEAVMSAIPTSLRSYVTPGYMQFRAFDLRGYPIALCLGVKMTRGDASRVCIGGGSNNNIRSCGDFVGWDGDYRSRATTYSPSSTGRPLYYIDSSILIFTR